MAGGTAASAKAIPNSPVFRLAGAGVIVGDAAAAEANPKNPRLRSAGVADGIDIAGETDKQVQALESLLAPQVVGT